VNTILEGSVRKVGNRIRVTAQLITAADGSHLWSERYDRELTDIFAIQDEISQAITEKLRVRLAEEGPLIKRHTENVEAYSLYLRGRYYLSRATAEHFAKSKDCFEQAVAMDPNYALAWHGLAMYYWFLGYRGFTVPITANGKSIQAAQKALRIDEMLPEAHSMMAVLWASEFDWNEGEREFRRALELDPNSAEVWQNYSRYFLVPMRRRPEKTDIEVTPVGLGCWQFSAGKGTANTSKWSPNRQRIAFVTYPLIP
jgi:adenylate cyclase